jgi:hypothetical protein
MEPLNTAGNRWRIAFIAGVPGAAAVLLFLHGRITQSEALPNYHHFADQRAFWGVPNFWNVVSNLGFPIAAVWGLRAAGRAAAFTERWERTAYRILLAAVALVAVGSAYYHAWPDDATLFWDRLPMAAVFMALLAAAIGERTSPRAGRLLLFPLLAVGVVSVVYWRFSGDLRVYGLVQFYTVTALPLLLVLFPPRYSGTAGILAMAAFYALALAFDRLDHHIAAYISTGGHPWKHVAAAVAMICYVRTIERRRPLAP